MNDRPGTGFRAAGNPLLQIGSLLVAAVALVAAFLMGAVLLAVILGLVVLGSVVLAVRIWWFRRKLRQAAAASGRPASGPSQPGRLIEAEYEVLEERDAGRAGERRDSPDRTGR